MIRDLLFELEYLESLEDYIPVKLNIFNTYRDTVLAVSLMVLTK